MSKICCFTAQASRIGAALSILVLVGCTQSVGHVTTVPDEVVLAGADQRPLEKLKDEFHADYDAAIAHHSEVLQSRSPLIVNDLLNMTLYLSGRPPEKFPMRKATYFLMADSAHPPLALYSILTLTDFSPLGATGRSRLEALRAAITDGRARMAVEVQDPKTKARLEHILTATDAYAARLLGGEPPSREKFSTFASEVRDDLRQNLYVGAREHLRQFNDQIHKWRTENPNQNWSDLRVAVIGLHQPRQDYALSLFFRWLLREDAEEYRVVYAELPKAPFGTQKGEVNLNKEAHSYSLELLSKVDFDREASRLFFGDEHFLQHDVMGPAAASILHDSPKDEAFRPLR